jgi:glyoxylase-like metal-dependent hydrolase (beta-lactamase superfamily II)
MSEWVAVAEGVFLRRYDPMDISITVICGSDGVIVVDTRSSPAEAREIVADVATEFGLPIRAVINSHAHFDHTFGNQVFAALDGVPIYGHHLVAKHFRDFEAPRLQRQQADPSSEPGRDWSSVRLTPPTRTIAERTRITVSGRDMELIPLAPGHTDTDLAIFIPGQRVWILGDIVEESGPPMFGSGCFPLGWPGVLAGLLAEIQPDDVVVPGHGAIVTRSFVAAQFAQLSETSEFIRTSWARNGSIDEALATAPSQLPWPSPVLRSALETGYAQLRMAATTRKTH